MDRLLTCWPYRSLPQEGVSIPMDDFGASRDPSRLPARNHQQTYKKCILGAIISCLVVLVVILCITLGVIIHQRSTQQGKDEDKPATAPCLDASCLWVGAQRVAAANTSVSPCDNFFQYACGGHRDNDPVLAMNLRHSSTTEIKLHNMLLEQPKGEKEDSADSKLRRLYRSCLSGETRSQEAARKVLGHLQQMGGWWLLPNSNPSSFDLQRALEYSYGTLDMDLFWEIGYTLYHAYNSSALYLDISPSVAQPVLVDEPRRILFEEYVSSITKLYLRDMTSDTGEKVKERIQLFASDVVYMREKLLENEQNPERQSSEPDLMLFHANPEKDMKWADLVDARLGDHWKTEGQAIFHLPGITRARVTLLKSMVTDEEKRMLNSYVVWEILQNFIIAMPLEYRNVRETFLHKLGVETKERRGECQDMLTMELPEPLGSLFARHYSETESKQMVTEMAELMREEFMKDIAQYPWMDEATKKAAIYKVQNIKMLVEFPENLKNTTLIDSHHEELQILDSALFIDNYMAVKAFQRSILSKEIKEKSVDIFLVRRLFLSDILPASYYNILGLPVTVLELPIFGTSLPMHYNMASLGALLGYNLDDMIKRLQGYWMDGLYAKSVLSWETIKNWQHTIEEPSCLDNFTIPALSQSWKDMNIWVWLRNKGDLITETTGVRLAFKAYKTWRDQHASVPEKIIPGINLTPDQSFFMAYAQMVCLMDRHDLIMDEITPQDRVNFALGQLPEFAEAFRCGRSPMNPEDKCVLKILQPSQTKT